MAAKPDIAEAGASASAFRRDRNFDVIRDGWTWNAEQRFRELWELGATLGDIARVLNASRPSCGHKRKRLGLASRPSPIKRKDDPHV